MSLLQSRCDSLSASADASARDCADAVKRLAEALSRLATVEAAETEARLDNGKVCLDVAHPYMLFLVLGAFYCRT